MKENQLYVKDISDLEVWNSPWDVLQVKQVYPQAKRFDSFLAQVKDGELIVWGYYGKTVYENTPIFKIN